MAGNVNALILAGQREGAVDPLCEEAGIKWKALLPIQGKPMIDYVLGALDASPSIKAPYWISGLDKSLIDAPLNQSPSKAGPASSIVAAADAGFPYPFLVTTCDHALLTPEMVEVFLCGAQASCADFALGLAEKTVIAKAYPDTKRTYFKFSDIHISGCNLFYIRNEKGIKAVEFWRNAQQYRKKPIRLAHRLGVRTLLKYISGGLSLAGAFEHASKILNIDAKPILIPIAEAAIDVDKPSDLTLVETILQARNG
ncbi:MAG: nucleotidyltransferase family protein [Robiginitomaculum sp.]